MKLFTEREIREAFAQGYDWCHNKYMPSDNMIDIFIRELPVVQLPTWEMIEKRALDYSTWNPQRKSFFDGALWMKENILSGGNK